MENDLVFSVTIEVGGGGIVREIAIRCLQRDGKIWLWTGRKCERCRSRLLPAAYHRLHEVGVRFVRPGGVHEASRVQERLIRESHRIRRCGAPVKMKSSLRGIIRREPPTH